MLNFFVTLFNGLYHAGRYFIEGSNEMAYNHNSKLREARIQELERKIRASTELTVSTEEYIRCGQYFEDICNEFKEDFEFILGDGWKDELNIPNGYYATYHPTVSHHSFWVYHLILAKKGKMDGFKIRSGFPVGDFRIKDMNIRFIQRIERYLHIAGFKDINFALELAPIGDERRTPREVCGGDLLIDWIALYPTHRLW